MNTVLGIDVGATGMKGAPVDITSGQLTGERHKIPTPDGGDPDDMLQVIQQLVDHFDMSGKPVGIGFPAVIKDGLCLTATNIDKRWINYPIQKVISDRLGAPTHILNDADAAGQAEISFGRGKGIAGTVMLLTLGTGIGSAIFKNGSLLRNTELGQMIYKGERAEMLVSNSARKREDMSWETYGEALGGYLRYVNGLFYPDLIILGGGISKKFKNYQGGFQDLTNVVPATQLNNAGIVGAAMAAGLGNSD